MRHLTRRPSHLGACVAIALAVASLVIAHPAGAQTGPQTPQPSTGPYGMPMTEWQSLNCFWGGAIGASAVWYWSDVLTAPATGPINPILLAPTLAAGFLGGCSIISNLSPAILWIYRHL